MQISVSDRTLSKALDHDDPDKVLRALKKVYGARRAKELMKRLSQLQAAPTLAALGGPYTGPGRPHELSGNLKGKLSLDLDHPYRLLFRPDHNPIPVKPDGGLDWQQITEIVVESVTDTH